MLLYYSPLIRYRIRIYMLKQYNGLYNIDYKIQVIQCHECHLERCLSGKCSNCVSRLVKTVHTQLFAKNVKFHKLATTNAKKSIISDMRHCIMYIDGHESKPANSNFFIYFLVDKFKGNTLLHNVLKNLVPTYTPHLSIVKTGYLSHSHFSTKQNRS